MRIGMRTVKTAIGAMVAMYIAQFFQLEYAISAGIITILSIQNTKRDSFKLALQRLGSICLALMIASFLFYFLGFQPAVFALYLLLFIPVTVKFKWTDSIVVSSVLVTHLLIEESISFFWIRNELLLMLVGVGIAILLNLYMPNSELKLIEKQKELEENMRQVLSEMADSLRAGEIYQDEQERMNQLKSSLKSAEAMAQTYLNNFLLKEARYYIQYFDMRQMQFRMLLLMKSHLIEFHLTQEQREQIAEIVGNTSACLDEKNSGYQLLQAAEQLALTFKESDLPQTRGEFEERATLFQFLNDFQHLLEIKHEFYHEIYK